MSTVQSGPSPLVENAVRVVIYRGVTASTLHVVVHVPHEGSIHVLHGPTHGVHKPVQIGADGIVHAAVVHGPDYALLVEVLDLVYRTSDHPVCWSSIPCGNGTPRQ